MPDTLTPTQPNIPEGATPEEVFAAFQPAETSTPVQAPATEPEQPAQKPAEKAPDTKVQDIPEQFLTGKKTEQAQEPDEYEKMMSEDPKGQLKHDDWKRYKSAVSKKVDALTAQLREREEKLQAAEKRGVPEDVAKKLEEYEKALAEREEVIARSAVQESKAWKEKFGPRDGFITTQIKKLGEELGIDANELNSALNSSPKKRSEILNSLELDESSRQMVIGIFNKYDEVQYEKSEYLTDAKSKLAAQQERERADWEAKEQYRSQEIDRVFERVIEDMSHKLQYLQEVEGNQVWNGWVKDARAEAKKYYSDSQLSYEQMAMVGARAAASFVQDRLISALQEKNTQLEEAISSLKRSQPGSNGSLPHQSGTSDDSHLTLEQRRMQTFNRFVGGQ